MSEANEIIDGPTELPKDGSVDTEFGPMEVRFMYDSVHPTITLSANCGKGAEFITVNGVEMRASLTMADYGDGFEPRKDEQGRTHGALYASRVDAKKGVVSSAGFDVSDADKKKLFAALPGVAREWAVGKEDTLTEARRASAYSTIRTLRSDLETAQEKVEDLQTQIDAAEDHYCEIPGPRTARCASSGRDFTAKQARVAYSAMSRHAFGPNRNR